MKAFKSHCGLLATLDKANVDTDQIIPKQFLKMITRTGFGEYLFNDWRLSPDGMPNPEFELNREEFRGASILVSRSNFGCGSSREHAVWAIQQYGFEVVIAPLIKHQDSFVPAFADIFKNNSAKNGLLTVELKESEVDEIFSLVEKHRSIKADVDLEHQRVTLHLKEDDISYPFDIDQAVKERLINGHDEISLTLLYDNDICSFESQHDVQLFKH
ncbi:MAG: 3-isopropylmalate dehydratase small subunit [Chlamydiota bacterium]|nr:3-isopropylmalate dehydratase small subunit [Chlamydiota bacterium]